MFAAARLERLRISMIRRAHVEHAGVTHDVVLLNVGLRGVFVEWPGAPLARDERVRISFRLPGDTVPIEAGCRVAWWSDATRSPTSPPDGMGLQFSEISEANHLRLRAQLEEHARRDPSERQLVRG